MNRDEPKSTPATREFRREAETGADRKRRQWSIRINDPWRICFRSADGLASDVEIVDYH